MSYKTIRGHGHRDGTHRDYIARSGLKLGAIQALICNIFDVLKENIYIFSLLLISLGWSMNPVSNPQPSLTLVRVAYFQSTPRRGGQLNSTWPNSSQSNSTCLNSTQPNSTRPKSTWSNSTWSNSTWPNSTWPKSTCPLKTKQSSILLYKKINQTKPQG